MKNIKRNSIMKKLEKTLNHNEMAEIFGISRERVAQILGRIGRNEVKDLMRKSVRRQKIKEFLEKGYNQKQIQDELTIGSGTFHTDLLALGIDYHFFRTLRRAKKIAEIERQVLEIAKLNNNCINTTILQRYNRTIAAQVQRYKVSLENIRQKYNLNIPTRTTSYSLRKDRKPEFKKYFSTPNTVRNYASGTNYTELYATTLVRRAIDNNQLKIVGKRGKARLIVLVNK